MKAKKTTRKTAMTDAEIKEAIRRDKEWMNNLNPEDEIEIPEDGIKGLSGDDDDESADKESEEFAAEGEFGEDDADEEENDEIAEITNVRGKARAHVVDPSDFLNGQGTNFIRTGLNIYVATDGCGRALAAPVRPGKFHEDLFMRLNVVQLRVPPLREHLEDIDDIADHWWFGRFRKHLSPEQLAALKDYGYPGNVREFMNLLERAAVLGEGDFARLVAQHREMNAGFEADEEPSSGADVPPELLDEAIRHHVRRIFCKYARNVTRAAAALGISRTTLRKWM